MSMLRAFFSSTDRARDASCGGEAGSAGISNLEIAKSGSIPMGVWLTALGQIMGGGGGLGPDKIINLALVRIT